MAEPLITMAKNLTGKILAGNPNMPTSSKRIMNAFNNAMYRNKG